jgi:membrane fusion protein, copper/silver efflux system
MRKTIYAVALVLVMVASYFVGRHEISGVVAAGGPHRVLYYVDPMHPAYKSDKPGIAPDCGMQLEPVYADGPGTNDSGVAAMPPGTVKIDSERQQLAGVRVASAEKVSGTRTVRILGKVAADDRLVYRINAGVEGWVRETFDASIGSHVTKDEKLATYYSPDFVTQINSYLVATDRLTVNVKESGRGVEAAAARLRNLGMSDMQIKELGETRQLPESIYAVAPADGFIIARNISSGLRFERGAEFYRVADISRVWIMADVFENEARYYHPGMVATVTAPQLGKTLRARVSEVLPQFDPVTRTMKVRLEAQNPGFTLRPDMFVDIELPVNVPAGVSVPVDALIDSGRAKRIFVDRGNGFFEPREVEAGARFDDRVVIVKGLNEGERVVVAGTFLVDSESRLKTVAAGMHESRQDDSMPPPKKEGSSHGMAEMKQAKMSVGETVDHKCGMKIDRAKSVAEGNTLEYQGTTYYFCSRACKDGFAKRPEQYLSASHQAGGQ